MVTAGSPLGPNLVKHAEAYIQRLAASMTDDELRLRHATAALIAISAWAETHPSKLLDGADGVQRVWQSTTLSVRAPHQCAHLTAVLGEIAKGNLAHANEASLVLELVFGVRASCWEATCRTNAPGVGSWTPDGNPLCAGTRRWPRTWY